jgi:hypothetical protein
MRWGSLAFDVHRIASASHTWNIGRSCNDNDNYDCAPEQRISCSCKELVVIRVVIAVPVLLLSHKEISMFYNAASRWPFSRTCTAPLCRLAGRLWRRLFTKSSTQTRHADRHLDDNNNRLLDIRDTHDNPKVGCHVIPDCM